MGFSHDHVYVKLSGVELVGDSEPNLERANLVHTLLFVGVALMI